MREPAAWVRLLAPAGLVRHRLAAGETLFRQGDPSAAIYRLDRGRVRLVRHLSDGSSVALHTARPGETFAEAALFADAYHCDAVAEAPSEVSVIPKGGLLAALAMDPEAVMDLARVLAVQVRDLRAHLELRNIRSASDRILAWLRLHATGAPPTVRLDRPWTEIAAEIGLTREAIYRTLAALERDGRIQRRSGGIVLPCPGEGPQPLRDRG